MRARIGGRTTLESLSPQLREAVEKSAQQRAEEYWHDLRDEAGRRFIYSLALALNDVYGFGTVRVQRVIDAIGEITTGYSEDSYTPSERRVGADMKRMTDAMHDELKRRNLNI